MKNLKKIVIYFQLELKCPVHIGSNEVYEPTGFVVDDGKKLLVSFDPVYFIASLDNSAREELSCICRKGTSASLVEVYRFMNGHKDDVREGKTVGVSSAFVTHFNKTLSLTGEKEIVNNLNKYEIKRTAFNPHDNTLYIPGSSIKGSIRTAVLDYRNGGKRKPFFKKSSDMEEELLGGSFQTDPFRLVKVSDFMPAGNIESRIVYGVNRKKKTSKFDARGPEQILEVVNAGAVFWGFITIEEPPAGSKIKKPVTRKELLSALAQFYGREKKREEAELNAVGIPPVPFDHASDQYPVRIGFHSGAECVTVDGHRKIRIMKGKGQAEKKEQATTLWLAGDSKDESNSQLKPFGWAVLKELSSVENTRLCREVELEKKKKREIEKEIIDKKLKERKKREDAFLAKEQEKNRKNETEEAARKALAEKMEQWKKLDEKERDLALVKGDELARICAPKTDILRDVWPRLASADPDHRKALAAAFRDRWKKDGKWDVKKKKSKQFEKVKRVKEILAETGIMEKGE